jgi:flagellar biosynthetic protein FliR
LESYRIVGLGKAGFGPAFSQRLIYMSGETLQFGLKLAAPVAASLFAVNIVFGVLSKAMPQLNILVLSFAVSALIGFAVLFLSIPEFQGEIREILSKIGDWMEGLMLAQVGK